MRRPLDSQAGRKEPKNAGMTGPKKSNRTPTQLLGSCSQLKTVRNDPAHKILAGNNMIFTWKTDPCAGNRPTGNL